MPLSIAQSGALPSFQGKKLLKLWTPERMRYHDDPLQRATRGGASLTVSQLVENVKHAMTILRRTASRKLTDIIFIRPSMVAL